MTLTDQSKVKKIESIENFQGGKPVTIDWGLPPGVKSGKETGRKTPTEQSSRPTSPSVIKSHNHEETPGILVKNKSVIDLIDTSTVSNIIRKRLNQSHAQEAILRATNNTGSLDPLANANAMKSKLNEDGTPGTTVKTSNKLIEMPFVMVQIHREYARNSPTGGAVQGSRRLLKSYLRICGSFPSISKAKEMADKQMENIFLTLYQSNTSQQNELLLNWNTFRGFESIPVEDSDHFLIYCRSSPMEYASIFPSKNILFSPFPAICRLANQRFAVAVMNQIISDENPLLNGPAGSPKKKKQIVIGSKVKGNHKKEVVIGLAGNDSIGPEADEEVFDVNHPPDRGSDDEELEENAVSAKSVSNKSKKNLTSRKISTMGVNANSALLSGANISSRHSIRKGASSSVLEATTPVAPSSTEQGLTGGTAQTESAVTLPEFISTKKSSWPLYLQEFSCLYESLVVTATRLDCLRYAIRRFGTMPSDILSRASSLMGGIEGTMASTGMMDTSNPETTAVHGNSTSTIQLKAMNDSNKADRILRVVHNEQKKICVLPLFKWVLLNEETVETLNFLYAFKESTIRKILLAEELDQTQEETAYEEEDIDMDNPQLLQLTGNPDGNEQGQKRFPGEYRDLISEIEEKHLHPEMVKSFSEAGFIPQDPLRNMNTKALDEGMNRSHSTGGLKAARSDGGILFIDNNSKRSNAMSKIEVIADQARALKILEREVASKEMSKQIQVMQSQFMTHSAQSYKMNAGTGMSSYPMLMPMSPQRPSDEDSTSTGNIRSKTQKDSVQLENRLKLLNKAVHETHRILNTHDQLCELEHGTPTKKDDDSSYQQLHEKKSVEAAEALRLRPQYVSPKASPQKKSIPKEEKLRLSKDNKSGIMKERLNVIESLQKMQFVPSKSSMSTSNSAPTIQPTSSAVGPVSVSGNAAVSALFGLGKSANQGPTSQTTVAGRRLAESLRILSESLDTQLQQKMSVSASQTSFG
jgi:hypothetical protein